MHFLYRNVLFIFVKNNLILNAMGIINKKEPLSYNSNKEFKKLREDDLKDITGGSITVSSFATEKYVACDSKIKKFCESKGETFNINRCRCEL